MKIPTCVFNLENDGSDDLLLYLEPEGCEFNLPPGKSVEVYLFGNEHPIQMQNSVDETGKGTVSFWPVSGSYELFFEGVSVWNLVK